MIKINYPGSVVFGSPFEWSIRNAPQGATWTLRRIANNTVQEELTGAIPASGTYRSTNATMPTGEYRIDISLSTGERFRFFVRCYAEPTFIWRPDYQAEVSKAPAVRTIRFGDGYSQEFPAGINNNPANWALTFSNLTDMESRQLMMFLDAMGGVRSFIWVDDDGKRLRYKCKTYSRIKPELDDNSVRAQFEQSFI